MGFETGSVDDNGVARKTEQPKSSTLLLELIKGIIGAIVGGVVGYFLFDWLTSQGFYSLVLPGALLGLGFGLASRYKSIAFGIICAIAAIALGLFSEWSVFPFVDDNTLSYFLSHLNQLRPVTWIMLIVGALLAFWFARGR